MSQNSQQDNSSGGPKGPSFGDVVVQTLVTAATFAVVSSVAGPVVGAIAASIVGGGDGSPGGAS